MSTSAERHTHTHTRIRIRCGWCEIGAQGADPLYLAYHDHEWGVPQHDEHTLFEFLVLEGAQAGLSWLTILRKREGYRTAFAQFDPQRVARFGTADEARLLACSAIVRNQQKIHAAIGNARHFLDIQEHYGSFDRFLWDFVDGQPITHHWRTLAEVPSHTPIAEKLSKTLYQRGFRFVGPTICYSLMQATGLVNDHLVACFRHAEISHSRLKIHPS